MIKVFGVGNIMLCDDGIGVKVAEYIKKELESNENIELNKNKELSKNIEVIIGETDFMYCLDCINKDDFVVIIDGTYFDFKPGYISKLSFEECDNLIVESRDPHGDSLLKVLRREYREINGYLIGIEIDKVDYSLDLSPKLNKEFNSICNRVLDKIKTLICLSEVQINRKSVV
ncbi:hydrogenase maturation protease [Clostridium gasigenes]|uniref:Hydrogenase maturation protease n=1 Tax=Clostridium gasigenes TaxID=94869 RepID=A0A1H0LWX3_9CLOT|nr:hydrogenase maturation protease [Clostridium gasigenes]SDO72604.1 hydrogenase maturation protease [Clostridium gasigenes]